MDEHEHYGPGAPVNAAEVATIIAERDRLRAIVERAHDHVGQDERALRSLATDDLVALVGVLRRDYALAANAADAAAEAVGNTAEKCSTLMAERDGWFRDLDEIAAELQGEVDSDGPTTVQLIDLVRGVRDERDRLRAVVDGLRGYLSLQDVGEEPSEVTGVFSDLRAILAEPDGSAGATDE